jgi:hypothetical protein
MSILSLVLRRALAVVAASPKNWAVTRGARELAEMTSALDGGGVGVTVVPGAVVATDVLLTSVAVVDLVIEDDRREEPLVVVRRVVEESIEVLEVVISEEAVVLPLPVVPFTSAVVDVLSVEEDGGGVAGVVQSSPSQEAGQVQRNTTSVLPSPLPLPSSSARGS